MADITYCINEQCPFKKCERHLSKVAKTQKQYVSVANFDGICRKYIGYLVHLAEMGEK
jgi:hypothetical protein